MKNASSDKNISQNKIISILKNSLSKELKENETSSVALKVFYSYLKNKKYNFVMFPVSLVIIDAEKMT